MTKANDFCELVTKATAREALKKLVFSRPNEKSDAVKVTGRLCAHRGRRILALEFALPSSTVAQKNIPEEKIGEEILLLLSKYKQANLITAIGDAEWKISKSGKEALLGYDALMRKMSGEQARFESAIEALDKKKNYLLSGKEDFLKKLKISDATGRIHDKMQGKFRQINRFLEHISDIYDNLPSDGRITVYDLCCGKSYLSFAVYYYLTEMRHREVFMLGIDLKADVIDWCASLAGELGYTGMQFVADDVTNTPNNITPDMVISLHACDVATDIVINTAADLGAKVILSTPCCHKYMNDKLTASELKFASDYPHLRGKLCEALTDAVRAERLKSMGYAVSVVELTDPENTPKNTLIRAIKKASADDDYIKAHKEKYEAILTFLFGDGKHSYLKEISK